MLVVMVLMLVVIVVPVAVIGLPMSKIVVTMTNEDLGDYQYVQFGIRGAADKFDAFYLDSGEEVVYEFSVAMGEYFISVQWWVENWSRYQSIERSGSVSVFEMEHLRLTLRSS
jgi:hypothetical protein